MVSAVRTPETREQAIARLAQKARESGVKVLRDRKDGRFYASSASTIGLFHYTTAVSCDCKGFASHGRCMHHAALLVALGWAGTDPEPEPSHITVICEPSLSETESEPTTCRFCHGQGSEAATELYMGRRLDIRITCWHCKGSGQLAA